MFKSLHAGASGGISITLFFVEVFSPFLVLLTRGKNQIQFLHKVWRFRIKDMNEKRFSIYLTKNETYFSKHATASMPREKHLSLEKWIAQLFISKKLWGNFSRPKPQSIAGLHKHMLQVFWGRQVGKPQLLKNTPLNRLYLCIDCINATEKKQTKQQQWIQHPGTIGLPK